MNKFEKTLIQTIVVAITGTMLYCTPNAPRESDRPDAFHVGMKQIAASNHSFFQGADDTSASNDEKPVFLSKFSYDYWLDSTDVTQKEYADITGKRPVSDTCGFGVGDRYPVYNVSWFDAVLYCNAKSKVQHLDTVYSYFGAPEIQNGSVYELAGMQIHYDRNGYRLPTEAEWEFAAREGSSVFPFPHLKDSLIAGAYAWYDQNAGGKTHPVAQLVPNAFGLYDMAGNVFQWTDDWKGSYSPSAIVNSIGFQLPNSNTEKVIKGGSFENGFVCLRPSRRGTTYPTSQSSIAEYIGFRCARGIIPDPAFISGDTTHTSTNPVNLTVTSVKSFLGTTTAKIVFVNVTKNVRTLCYTDFSKAYPVIQEVKDIQTVYAPTISPDGKYVAFCTRSNFGSTGQSITYIRKLDSLVLPPIRLISDSAFAPRWWVDPASNDTFLIYTNSTIDNTSALWSNTQTFMVKIVSGKSAGTPQAIAINGSYHDGRSQNGQYIVTGYRQLIMYDMFGKKTQQLFTYPENGKSGDGSTQACNVSISQDSVFQDRCLFLDFGAPTGSSLVGSAYGMHEYLFMSGFSGKVNAWYKYPDGESAWDNPEWSNVGQFAIACGSNSSGEPHALYLMDLLGSLNALIAQGQDIENPCLWINGTKMTDTGTLCLDSLGDYTDPPLAYNVAHFAKRMLGFWRVHNTMGVVFVGSSHTGNSVDPNIFTGQPVYNMALSGGPMGLSIQIINNYLLNNCPAIKLIGCDIIPGCMNNSGYYGDWNQLVPNKGYNYDKNHSFWKAGLPPNFEKFIALVPVPDLPDNLPNGDTLGLYPSTCANWGGPTPDEEGSLTWDTTDEVYTANFNKIKVLAQELALRKIHFLLYLTPESPYYKTTGYYGRYGPSRQTGEAIVSQLKSLQDSIPGYFHFYDANLEGNHDYADSEAINFDHLCPAGARKFSGRLDSMVHVILKDN